MRPRSPAVCQDPLTDVLRTVRLKGALFFVVDATSPWCVNIPPAREFADIILPSARSVVSYHIVVEGRGIASVPGAEPVRFGPGDIIVFPHGDTYVMSSEKNVPPELDREQTFQFFRDLVAGKLPFVIAEGGGGNPKARFICGFLGCDMPPFTPLFSPLPPILHVRGQSDGRPDLLDQLIHFALAEAATPRFGGASIRLGLSELMFVEVLRRHLEALAADEPGWLAGLRDPIVGRALARLHGAPANAWTLASLAAASGVSRSVLAERFARYVGETPMRYLTRWRMQIAARLLTDGMIKVAAVGEQVGFRSEAAFSRTFRKMIGVSPTEWRRTRAPL
jgi:AraC-like DNA-binding protein